MKISNYLFGFSIFVQIMKAQVVHFSDLNEELSNLETIEGEQATDKELTATQACLSSSKDCKARKVKSKIVPLKIVVQKTTPLQKKV